MARLGVSKKKKSPRATELSQLKKELKRITEQLESRDREQTATSEILRLIAALSTDLQAVLDTISESAARVCGAEDAVIRLVEGNMLRRVAHHGSIPVSQVSEIPIDRDTVTGRAVVDCQVIHVEDRADTRGGMSTSLVVPLMREGIPIGTIHICRTEVRAFTDKQITLLKTFADQAVIAIENARLLQERETRNRDLAALHDVIAAASQSLEIKPVLDEVVKKITEIFAFDSVSIYLFDPQSEYLNPATSFGTHVEVRLPRVFRHGSLTGRVAGDRRADPF
jgi:two-component system, NtrC family, sensor kinase